MVNHWKAIDYMTDEELIVYFNKIKELKAIYHPQYILSDDSKRNFGYPPHIQEAVAKSFINTDGNDKLEKYAVISPKDLVAELSTSQLREELGIKTHIQIQFFHTEEEAMHWLSNP